MESRVPVSRQSIPRPSCPETLRPLPCRRGPASRDLTPVPDSPRPVPTEASPQDFYQRFPASATAPLTLPVRGSRPPEDLPALLDVCPWAPPGYAPHDGPTHSSHCKAWTAGRRARPTRQGHLAAQATPAPRQSGHPPRRQFSVEKLPEAFGSQPPGLYGRGPRHLSTNSKAEVTV